MKWRKILFTVGFAIAIFLTAAGCEPNIYIKVNNRYPFPIHLAAHFNDAVTNKPVVVDIGTVAANSSATLNGGMKGDYFNGAIITDAKGKKIAVVDTDASDHWRDGITVGPPADSKQKTPAVLR